MEPYEPFSETVREDPYPYYAALRDEAPVYWAEGAQAWCVSRYDDVQFVLRNAELFSSDAMRTMLMGLVRRQPARGSRGRWHARWH
jgi:cytochrome P450